MSEHKKSVLIGVGGSGQHVVHAYLRLLALSNASANIVPHVYIIDADAKKSTASGSDVLLGRNIDDLHQQLTASIDEKVRPKCIFIMPAPDTHEQGAKQALGFNNEAGWANAFLLEDDVNVQVSRGMMANARVGASVFGVNKETLTKQLVFPQNSYIAIVGSTFGGTGSGVIPELVRSLDEKYKTSKGTGTVIRAFMTLPWFEIDSSGVSAESKSAASVQQDDISPMERNASLGLRTYLDDSKILKQSNYFVSQFTAGAVRTDGTNFNQDENPHVFNLVIANAVHNFLQGDDEVKGRLQTEGEPAVRNMFTFGVNKDEFEKGLFSAKTSPHLNIKIANNQKRNLEDIVRNAELWALVLEKGALYIQAGDMQFVPNEQSTKHDEPAALKGFLKQVAIKKGGSEKKEDNILLVEKKSGLFSKEVVAKDDVYNELAKQLNSMADIIRGSLLWLEHHEKTGLSYSKRIPHLFTPPLVNSDYRTLKSASLDEVDLKKSWNWVDYNIDSIKRKQTGDTLKGDGNTPYIARAFTLLTNVFFAEKSAGAAETVLVKSLNALIKTYTVELMSAQEGLDEESATKQIIDRHIYKLAAQVITEKAYEEVVDCRKHSASQSDTSSLIMLKEEGRGEAIKPEDTNTPTVKIIPVHGFKDADDVLHDEHPLSIRHLDPYIGIKRISQLLPQNGSPAEKIFPETALKGIPNIVAPKLLQKWRLELEFTPSDKTQPIKTEMPIRLKPYGMFLHARRVIEAAFWLIFTKHNQLELKEHSFPDNCKFSKLIKKSLVDDSSLPVLCIQHKAGDIIFISDSEMGWYLAANKIARKFLAEIIPELPSVKYGDGLLNKLWAVGNKQNKPKDDSYDANVIAAFVVYLEEITKKENIKEQAPLLFKSLSDLITDLKPKIDSSKVVLTPSPASYKLPITAGDTIVLKELTLLGQFNDLFIKSPVYIDTSNTLERLWPLSGKAWQYIDIEKTIKESPFKVTSIKKSDENNRGSWQWDELTLNLKELGEKTFTQPFGLRPIPDISLQEDNFSWSTAVWPNFEAKQWAYYLAGGDSFQVEKNELKNIDLKGLSLRGDCLEFVFYGDIYNVSKNKVEFEEIGRVKNNVPIKLNGVPRCAEICFGGTVLGSIPIKLKETAKSDTPNKCSVALDFGTSNTCMALSVTLTGDNNGECKPSTLPLFEGELFNDKDPLESGLTWAAGSLVSNKAGTYYHQQLPTLFFQSFNQLASADKKPRSIPSELLFVAGVANPDVRKNIKLDGDKGYLGRSDIKEKYKNYALLSTFGQVEDCCLEGSRPVVVPLWTPFPPAIDKVLREKLINTSTTEDRVENFKWPSADVHYAYRAAYLESILVASFATLRLNGYSNIQKLIGTYPGAFEKKHKEGYFKDLNEIVKKLSERCGIVLETQPISERSETVAALVGCKRNVNDISLTIDMGGGTTDIGFVIPKAINGRLDETPDAYMSSLRYAGTHLLEAIVGQSFAVNGEDKSDAQKRIDLLNMKLKIREGTSDLTFGEEANNRYKLITEAFFRGLFEYVLNLVSAFTSQLDFPSQGKINLYFLGNGCNLVDVFCKSTAKILFETVCNEAVAAGLLTGNIRGRFDYPTLEGIDKKQMLIKGALHDIETTPEGRQYKHIEDQGHGGRAIWLPCIKDDNQLSQKITLGSLTAKNANNYSDPILCSAEDESLKSSFGLTHKYWQAVELDPRKLVSLVPTSEYKDFGKYYLEKKFVTEVLCKLTKEPVVEKAKPKPATSNSSSSTQQSGFNSSSVSESAGTPNVPPQNPNNAADTVKLTSGGNTPINAENITITLNWQSPFELDIIAFALNDKGKVTADENTIFYNQPDYAQGAVLLNAAQRQVNISLNKIPSHIKTIAICVVTGIDDESAKGKNFGQVSNSVINITASNNIIFELTHIKGIETAIIFGEVYRHNNAWKFRAKGHGYAGGFKKMCDEYGAQY